MKLARAVICLEADCEWIFTLATAAPARKGYGAECPACGSAQFVPLAKWLDRTKASPITLDCELWLIPDPDGLAGPRLIYPIVTDQRGQGAPGIMTGVLRVLRPGEAVQIEPPTYQMGL